MMYPRRRMKHSKTTTKQEKASNTKTLDTVKVYEDAAARVQNFNQRIALQRLKEAQENAEAYTEGCGTDDVAFSCVSAKNRAYYIKILEESRDLWDLVKQAAYDLNRIELSAEAAKTKNTSIPVLECDGSCECGCSP